MPRRLSFEIVPISEVPSTKSSAEADRSETRPAHDGQASAESSDTTEEEAVGFAVLGLPHGQRAWIRRKHGKYRLLLEVHSGQTEWLGEYASVDDALQALSDKLMPGLFL